MSLRSFAVKPLALAALLGLAGGAHASFITYDAGTVAAFNAAVTKVGTDTFTTLASGDLGTSVPRTAGSYSYTATALSDTLYGVGGQLSTSYSTDVISFNSFSSTVTAIGGNFTSLLGSGTFIAGSPILLTVVDTAGTHDFTFSPTASTGTGSFFGITSTSAITALYVSSPSGSTFPTIDNLQLAVAVPEPETYALMLGGLALVAFARRRQSKPAA